MVVPLNPLFKKDVPFHLSKECEMAFGQLKNSLVTAPVLVYPQFESSYPFVVETNATIQGLGVVLSQRRPGGKKSPHSLCIQES